MIDVSVIVPTYGEPKFLDRTIQSVLKQTLTNIELIVVDDNNPDTRERRSTERVISKYSSDERLYYEKHPQNLNGAVARNTGIAKAHGKYISFLDSDDEYMPERLEKCFHVMEHADSNIAGVYTGCEFRRSGKKYLTFTDVHEGNYLVQTLACTFMLCTGSNIFIRKSVVDELKGFDGTFLRHQDYEFMVRLFERYSLAAIPEALVIKNNENVNVPSIEKMVGIKKQYIKKYRTQINALPQKEQDYVYHSQFIQLAEAALRVKDYGRANSFYRRAGRHGGLSLKESTRRIALTGQSLLKK